MNLLLFFIGFLTCFVCGILIYIFGIKKKLKCVNSINERIKQEEQDALKNTIELQHQNELLYNEISSQTATKQELEKEIIQKQTQLQDLGQHLQDIEAQTKKVVDAVYEKNFALMENALEHSAEELGAKYQKEQEIYQQEYLAVLQDLAQSFADEVAEKKEQVSEAEALLLELKSKVWAAIMANKRALEIQEQANYYRLNLSVIDLEEIKKLRSVIPYLKDQEPLNKVIWKVYYEKPYQDLVGRVIGPEVRSGIYKITNLTNQMCYVGQSCDLAARWKQHIKRGLGAETPTRNKLYPAMAEFGVENFSFEVIEECARADLDEREDFWQNYFQAREFGYSIK